MYVNLPLSTTWSTPGVTGSRHHCFTMGKVSPSSDLGVEIENCCTQNYIPQKTRNIFRKLPRRMCAVRSHEKGGATTVRHLEKFCVHTVINYISQPSSCTALGPARGPECDGLHMLAALLPTSRAGVAQLCTLRDFFFKYMDKHFYIHSFASSKQ